MHSASLWTPPVPVGLEQDELTRDQGGPGRSAIAGMGFRPRVSAARGVLLGMVLGAGSWAAIYQLLQAWKP